MPLTAKGREILSGLIRRHGEQAGTRIFFASINAGRIKRSVVEAGQGRRTREAT